MTKIKTLYVVQKNNLTKVPENEADFKVFNSLTDAKNQYIEWVVHFDDLFSNLSKQDNINYANYTEKAFNGDTDEEIKVTSFNNSRQQSIANVTLRTANIVINDDINKIYFIQQTFVKKQLPQLEIYGIKHIAESDLAGQLVYESSKNKYKSKYLNKSEKDGLKNTIVLKNKNSKIISFINTGTKTIE